MTEVVQNIPFRIKHKDMDLQGLKDAIDEAFLTYHERKWIKKETFSPSKLGYGHGRCPRYWHIAFTGAEFVEEPDARGVMNMLMGTLAHDRLDELFRRSPLDVVDSEREVKTEDPPIRGFIDIVIRKTSGEEITGEFKTSGHRSFMWRMSKMEASGYHILQVLLYMWATESDEALIIYESKDSHQLLIIPVYKADHVEDLEELLGWMRKVRSTWENDEIAIRPYRSNSKVCKGCPVRETCFESFREGDVKLETLSVLQ